MIEVQKERLSVNRMITEKKEIISIESDMIVPDSKPDILNTISTSGVVSIYKKETLDGKVRIDGTINTYIMYMPDGTEDNVRGLTTNIDFSENIDMPDCSAEMYTILSSNVKNIETRVINGRKVGIKASIELNIKVYSSEEIEVIDDVSKDSNVQILKENLKLNSLIGKGETKVYAKDNISFDSTDILAEILRTNISIVDKDIKISYNKILSKAELNVYIMYLTEDNNINKINYKIPIVGFIDMPNVTEDNICDVNYELRNLIIKPNTQEEHSIYVEAEIGVICFSYEEKQINLIQDMYSPFENIKFNKRTITAMSDKQNLSNTISVNDKISFNDIQGLTLLDVEINYVILKETKINSKILYEAELYMKFIFRDTQMNISIKEARLPFQYTIDNLKDGESLNTNNFLEIKNKDFIVQENGDINCNIEIEDYINLNRDVNINIIDTIEESGEREKQDYSLIVYVVQKGDTLWKIAKEFGSTVDCIASINNIEDADSIYPNEKLYIPRFERVLEKNYE